LADQSRRTRTVRKARHDEQMLVIGLGRFGGRLGMELMELGHEVLGVDADPAVVDRFVNRLTKVVVADTTRLEVLEQLGARDFNHVVVGIGDVEASILTVAELAALDVRDVWAKAVTTEHKRILEKVGATHVVLPEHEMGRRIAHQVTGKIMDYIELDAGFALVEARVPPEVVGRTLQEAQIRARWDVTVVCMKPEGGAFTYATPDSVLSAGSIVLVAGDTDKVEAFAELT
jgi:trk system potassium uptake protein TrkA